MDEIIDCPFCETDIDGSYWNCKHCNSTGKINKANAEEIQENNNFFNSILIP